MKQIIQNLSNGEILVLDTPTPSNKESGVLIATSNTVLSAGTERMLLNFGKANYINKDIQQPKSFEHKTDATGIVASAGYRYLTDDLWGLSVSVDYQKWEGDSGSETLYTVNDEQFNSKLNDVDWKSLGINLGVNLNF